MSGKDGDGFNPVDYVPVAERVRGFRETYPDGSITTRLTTMRDREGNITSWEAYTRIWKVSPGTIPDHVERLPDADGYARQERLLEPPKKRNGDPNIFAPEWSSPMEVAETSAIGRALANLGYVTSRKGERAARPSREEMRRQEPDLHEMAWAYTVERVGLTDAETVFLDALRDAGVKGGGKITTAEEMAAVKAHADEIADGPGDGGGSPYP